MVPLREKKCRKFVNVINVFHLQTNLWISSFLLGQGGIERKCDFTRFISLRKRKKSMIHTYIHT